MSDDLPNQNNSNPWETYPPKPSYPSNSSPFPNLPNNTSNDTEQTVDPVQSWVAQHQQRDSSGRFASSEHPKAEPQTPHTLDHNIPSPVSFTQNTKYSEKNDPPLVSVSVTNPVTYLKLFLKRLLKNEGIDIHLKIKPLTVIACVSALSISFGTGFNVAQMFFPTSSPLLHRAITLQGNIQRSESGQYYLSLPDNSLWTLRPTNNNTSLSSLMSKQVMVKGNLTAEPNIIEVKEVISFEKSTPPATVKYPPSQSATNSAKSYP